MTMILIVLMEWGLLLTGVVAFGLAVSCWMQGWDELRAIRAARINGGFLAAARHHLWRSTFRALPSLLSVVVGVWLVLLPNDPDAPSLLSKACWLFYQVAMIINLLIERWSRAQVVK